MARKSQRFQYRPLRPDEHLLSMRVSDFVRDYDGIMETVDGYHREGLRCAVVFFLDAEGEFDDGYTAEQSAVDKQFPFEPVREAVATYDPSDAFCIVLARGSDVTALVAPRELP